MTVGQIASFAIGETASSHFQKMLSRRARMPYTMAIYPNEEERFPVPQVGDIFRVNKVVPNVRDMHWGRMTYVELERVVPMESVRVVVAQIRESVRPEFHVDIDEYAD